MNRFQRLAIIIPFLLLSSCEKESPGTDDLTLTLLFSGNTNADSSGLFSQKELIINRLRSDGKNILTFDSGNLFFNSEMVSSFDQKNVESKANLILELLNEMEITAINIGIDDLLLGEEFILSLKERANFVFISSNIFSTVTGKPLFFEFHVRKIAGLRVGIFGLTADTGNYPDSIEVRDPFEAASLMLKVLSRVSDLSIALSNMPLEMNEALADSVGSIDLILGYHNGEIPLNPKIVNGVPIYMTGLNGREIGKIELYLSNLRLGLTDITHKKVEAPNSASFSIIDLSEDAP